MKLKQLAAIIGLGLMGATATATAQEASLWSFQDDSIDFILRENGSGGFDVITGGAVQQGDIFIGIFEMPTASAVPPGRSLIPDGKELTGVSVVQLVTADPMVNFWWEFQPYTGGMNSILALAGHSGVVGGGVGGGAVAAMWLNNSPAGLSGKDPNVTDRNLVFDAADPNYPNSNCTSLADCLEEASLGSLFQVDGLWGDNPGDRWDPDNRWIALAGSVDFPPPVSYDNVKNGAATTRFGSFSASLSNLFNVTQPVLFQDRGTGALCPGATLGDADNCVQVKVSGDILGGTGLENGAIARDDIDAQKYVPEPATLGLLGLGLLGLGLMRRRLG